MSAANIRPIAEPREFTLEELFFSTTDLQGRITYGNPVFVRISGYSEDELLGSPHNIIRHPDMPRAVFKLLWDYIEDGRTIAAYVKNMAQDGRYYWVLAVAMPCDGGYLSVRLKPSSPLFTTVQDIYREALAVETAAAADASDRRAAMEAGGAKIIERLRQHGFASYDDFMREALSRELGARSETLGATIRRPTGIEHPTLHAIQRDCRQVGDLLEHLFASLGLFKRLNQELVEKSSGLYDMAETLHYESLNAKIAASKLEHGAAVLGAISRELSAASRDTESRISRFIELTHPIASLIGDVIFDVGAARLESEICTLFAFELAQHADSNNGELVRKSLQRLADETASRGRAVETRLRELMGAMDGLNTVASEIMAKVAEMKAVQFAGAKEALSRNDAAGFVTIFNAVGDRIARGKEDWGMLLETIAACRRCAADFVINAPVVRRLLDAVQRNASDSIADQLVAAR
ncbi:MAG: PAS domain-containing protein [Planctomycetales bacterium]|nr:PAS domain-containing protein [Planctomycetales bacterium]